MRTNKEHTFPWRSKNAQKRTKADEKRILCKSTLIELLLKLHSANSTEPKRYSKTVYPRYQ